MNFKITIAAVIAVCFAILAPFPLCAEEAEETLQAPPAPTIEEPPATSQVVVKVPENEVKAVKVLNLGLRMDLGFSAGSTLAQGFSLPSSRVTAFGELSETVDYRFSLGQTRDFSTALLPQMMPVEAFIQMGGRRNIPGAPAALAWRIGMMTPTFHPLWSPDLSDLQLPNYNENYKALFLSRDIGTEIEFFPSSQVSLALGAFNGNGIFSANTNNSRAFTASIKAKLYVSGEGEGDRSTLTLGGSIYNQNQSAKGSINFRNNWAAVAFASLWLVPNGISLTGDLLTGGFSDSTRIISPIGGSITGTVELNPWLTAFCRWENLKGNPVLNADSVRMQVGPILEWDHRNLQIFLYYENEDNSQGPVNSGQARVRLNI